MIYAAQFQAEPEGGYTVTFRDVPGVTYGETEQEALRMAQDALALVLSAYAEKGEPFPRPTAPKRGERLVFLPALIQAKLALWARVGELGINQTEFAERLGVDRKVVRRLMRLDHGSRIEKVEAALAELGTRLSVQVDTVGR